MNLRLSAAFLVFAGTAFVPCHADGVVILDFNQNQPDYVTRLRVNSDDSFHVQVGHQDGSLFQPICDFFRMGADGTLISTFGTGGRLSTGECAKDFSVRSNGALDMLDASGLFLQFRDASGALVSTSGRIFPAGTDPGYKSAASALLRLSNGQFMAGGYAGVCFTCDPGDLDWALARLNADGSVDSSFANGLLRKPSQRNLRTLVELPDAKVLGAAHAMAFGDATEFSRFDAVGLDFTYGLNAQVTVNLGVARIAIDSSGRAYVAGTGGEVVRLNTNGTVDGTYATAAPTPSIVIDAIAVDSMGRVVVFGGTEGQNSQAQIRRFTSTGALDTTFNGTGVVTFSFPQPIGYASYVSPCAGALQSLDRPLIACRVDNLNGQDLAVARFTDTGQLDVTFGANQLDTDLYPDAFIFANASAPYGSVGVVSAPVTVSGFDAGRETTVRVSGASSSISIGCNGTWATSGLIEPDETLCVRQNASATPGGTSMSTIIVGGRQATFTVVSTGTAADSIPDPFTFTAQTNAPLSTRVTSNNITVAGITGYSTATATNGTFSVGCSGSFVTSSAFITNGTVLCVRHTTASQYDTNVTTTLSIGGVSANFTSTTIPADLTPDAFSLTAQTNVALNTLVDSNTITVSGINAAAAISVTGGEYAVGCTSPNFTTVAGTVGPGQTVCVRHTTSSQYGTLVTTTLTIGGVSASFSSTTLPPDLTPDAFSLAAQTSSALSTLVNSNTIAVSGINGAAAISVNGGEYSVGCTSAAFTSAAGTVTNGQAVCVRHTTSAQYSTSVTTTLTIGGVAASFSSTTASAPSNGGGSGGGGGGAIDELLLAGLGLCMTLSFLERHRRRLQSR